MNTTLLRDVETAEFRAVDLLSRMAQHDPRRAEVQSILKLARAAKASALAASDTLRKSAVGPIYFGVGTPRERQAQDAAAVEMLKGMFSRARTLPQVGTDNDRLCAFLQGMAAR